MFKIPIIPPDLRHEETIIKAADALDRLQNTIHFVFKVIDERVAKNNVRIQHLGERIGKAQNKINSLVGTKKAIKIFSPSRFPATHTFHDIPDLFDSKALTLEQLNSNDYFVHSRVDPATAQTIQEKLIFFHVRTNLIGNMENMTDSNRLVTERNNTNQTNDLGPVPANISSVSSLLYFNSNEKVYKTMSTASDGIEETSMHSSWKRSKLFKNQKLPFVDAQNNTQQKQLLGPAPFSLVNRHHKIATPAGSLRYTPKLNEAPEIDLPLDLPDLPGIADDIHYEQQIQQVIAPSLFNDNIIDLPELISAEKKNLEMKNDINEIMNEIVESIPPPPPPLPPTATSLEHTTEIPIKPNSICAQQVPPPPPPPPPPPAPILTSPITSNQSSIRNDARSELMDSIRKAGGALGGRLRSAANVRNESVDRADGSTTNKIDKNKLSSGGDLMADLHNKLLMRRKGISGTKDPNEDNSIKHNISTKTDSVISRLSALIPPPQPSQVTGSKSLRKPNSDDEDEDNNDADWID